MIQRSKMQGVGSVDYYAFWVFKKIYSVFNSDFGFHLKSRANVITM